MHFAGQYCGLMLRCFIPRKTKAMDSKTNEKQRKTHENQRKTIKNQRGTKEGPIKNNANQWKTKGKTGDSQRNIRNRPKDKWKAKENTWKLTNNENPKINNEKPLVTKEKPKKNEWTIYKEN